MVLSDLLTLFLQPHLHSVRTNKDLVNTTICPLPAQHVEYKAQNLLYQANLDIIKNKIKPLYQFHLTYPFYSRYVLEVMLQINFPQRLGKRFWAFPILDLVLVSYHFYASLVPMCLFSVYSDVKEDSLSSSNMQLLQTCRTRLNLAL